MDKNSLTYRFLKGYMLGFAIAGGLYLLPAVGTIAQLLLGVSVGIVSWTWLKNMRDQLNNT